MRTTRKIILPLIVSVAAVSPALRGLPGADGETQFTQLPLAPCGNSQREFAGECRAAARSIAETKLAASRRTFRPARTLERRCSLQLCQRCARDYPRPDQPRSDAPRARFEHSARGRGRRGAIARFECFSLDSRTPARQPPEQTAGQTIFRCSESRSVSGRLINCSQIMMNILIGLRSQGPQGRPTDAKRTFQVRSRATY